MLSVALLIREELRTNQFAHILFKTHLFLLKPRAAIRFPNGEVSLEEKEDEELNKVLLVNGILKGQLMHGVCTAMYKENDLNLRYAYKVIGLQIPVLNCFF